MHELKKINDKFDEENKSLNDQIFSYQKQVSELIKKNSELLQTIQSLRTEIENGQIEKNKLKNELVEFQNHNDKPSQRARNNNSKERGTTMAKPPQTLEISTSHKIH